MDLQKRDSQSKPKKQANPETMRRLRVGDLQSYLRGRYRRVLPDADDGREDLRELLLAISLGQEASRKMENALQVWAPWLIDKATGKLTQEAAQLIDEINQLPIYLRKPTARELGERLGLTYEQRQAWGIRTIAPCDMTDEELAARRKARKQYLRWLRRRRAGTKTRAEWLAINSLSRTEPWKVEGISRRTWERRRRKRDDAGMVPIKLITTGTQPASRQQEDIRESKGQLRKTA